LKEDQSIISKQKVKDVSPSPHREARQQNSTCRNRNHHIQRLHHNDQQQKRQRIPLPQAIGAAKKKKQLVEELFTKTEKHRGNTESYPKAPFPPKPAPS
jgi:hypothetical protein